MRGFPITPLRRRLCGAVALIVCVCIAAQSTTPVPEPARPDLVAVGDVHGAFDNFSAILQRTGLIDANRHWSGAKTTLVQTGDLIDRGPKPREVMDLVIALEKEAPKAGGRVIPILGNHEMMNIMGDLRYVTAENYASFADNMSEKRQHEAYEQYDKWRNKHALLIARIPEHFHEKSEAEWIAHHPLGFIEQREAFSPAGTYGKWLRELPAVVKVDDVVFLHGGLSPNVESMKLDQINQRVHEEIAWFDKAMQTFAQQNLILPFFTLDEVTAIIEAEVNTPGSAQQPAGAVGENGPTQRQLMETFLGYGHWLSMASDGPLWFRGYSQWDETQHAEGVDKLLKTYKAAHIVVGHTPHAGGRIQSRFGGKIFLIDTGMLSTYYPQGKASALEVFGHTKFTARYMDQDIVLVNGTKAGGDEHLPENIRGPADQFGATPQLHP